MGQIIIDQELYPFSGHIPDQHLVGHEYVDLLPLPLVSNNLLILLFKVSMVGLAPKSFALQKFSDFVATLIRNADDDSNLGPRLVDRIKYSYVSLAIWTLYSLDSNYWSELVIVLIRGFEWWSLDPLAR